MSRVKYKIRPQLEHVTISFCAWAVTINLLAAISCGQPPHTPWSMPTTAFLALVLEQPFVAVAGGFIHCRRQFRTALLPSRRVPSWKFSSRWPSSATWPSASFFRLVSPRRSRARLPSARLRPVHQHDFPVFNLCGCRLCRFRFRGRAPCIPRSCGSRAAGWPYRAICVFFSLHIEFELLAFGLDLLDAGFGGVELGLGGGGQVAQVSRVPARFGQFLLHAVNFCGFAILQKSEVFDC